MKKGKKYTRILIWAYRKQESGFTWEELERKFNLNNLEKEWVKKIFKTTDDRDRKFFEHFRDDESVIPNIRYYSLNEKGISAALSYLDQQQTKRLSIVAVAIGIIALGVAMHTASLTKNAVELSADPILSIALDRNKIPKSADEATIAAGLIPTEDSMLKLALTNNSLSAVQDVDIRMTLWQFYVDDDSRHLTVCPLGYVDHGSNPNFVVSHLGTDNLFNKTFSLAKGKGYPFTVDFSNLENTILEPQDSRILLRIGVSYTKSVSQTNHSYVRLYVLNLFNEYVVDIDIAPDFALSLNDKKNEKEVDGLKLPSAVYPFQEEEFLKYFEGHIRKLDLIPSACREFTLLKEQKTITY